MPRYGGPRAAAVLLFYHFPDCCPFFFAYISIIQIAGYRRPGNTGQFCNFIDIHNASASRAFNLNLSYAFFLMSMWFLSHFLFFCMQILIQEINQNDQKRQQSDPDCLPGINIAGNRSKHHT